MAKTLRLTFESSLKDLCETNSSFDSGILRICYPGLNRNGSYIEKEDLERCAKSIYCIPVVGNYNRETNDFGGHDVEVVTASDGSLRLVNQTQPVGVVPESANVWFESVTDEDGSEKEYLCTDVLIWKRQEAYNKIKEDGVTSHSMEITVNDGEVIDGVYHIRDFEFTALCLLGADVEPCFENSSLEVFTSSDFKAQFELMMEDFKQSFTLAETSTEDKKYSQESLTKGGEEDLDEKTKEVFTDEAIEVDQKVDIDTTESEEDFEVEEVAEATEEIEEIVEEEVEEVETQEEESEEEEEESEEDFSLVMATIDEVREALYNAEKIADGEWEWPRYWFCELDPEIGMVYFCDSANEGKLFGANYVMDGDVAVIDFESAKRMKWIIVEFNEGDRDKAVAFVADVQQECIDSVSAKYEEDIAELEELREFKASAEKASAVKERKEIISQFEDLAGVEEFEELCENALDYSVEELEEKCFAIRGKNVNPTSTFSRKSNLPKLPVESNGIHDEDTKLPYGGVVEKYRNNN